MSVTTSIPRPARLLEVFRGLARQIRRFPEAPHGPWFANETAPAGPNAHKSPRLASQQAATHNDAPHGLPAGSQHTPNRQGVLITPGLIPHVSEDPGKAASRLD